MARSILAGAAGGSLAALVVGSTLQIQGWIWGATVQRGLPSERSLFWCLLWCGAIGVALSLLQRQRAGSSLPELNTPLPELRGGGEEFWRDVDAIRTSQERGDDQCGRKAT